MNTILLWVIVAAFVAAILIIAALVSQNNKLTEEIEELEEELGNAKVLADAMKIVIITKDGKQKTFNIEEDD